MTRRLTYIQLDDMLARESVNGKMVESLLGGGGVGGDDVGDCVSGDGSRGYSGSSSSSSDTYESTATSRAVNIDVIVDVQSSRDSRAQPRNVLGEGLFYTSYYCYTLILISTLSIITK